MVMDREAWQVAVDGVIKSQARLYIYIYNKETTFRENLNVLELLLLVTVMLIWFHLVIFARVTSWQVRD